MAEQQDNQDIDAISLALTSPDAQVRIQAIKSALAYGDAGAKLVIQLMKKVQTGKYGLPRGSVY